MHQRFRDYPKFEKDFVIRLIKAIDPSLGLHDSKHPKDPLDKIIQEATSNYEHSRYGSEGRDSRLLTISRTVGVLSRMRPAITAGHPISEGFIDILASQRAPFRSACCHIRLGIKALPAF